MMSKQLKEEDTAVNNYVKAKTISTHTIHNV